MLKIKELKEIFKYKPTQQSISILFYPEKILIQTLNQNKNGDWKETSDITVLKNSVSDQEFGHMLLNHIDRSTDNINLASNFIEVNEKVKMKEIIGNTSLESKMIRVTKKEGRLFITPTKNVGNNMDFHSLNEMVFTIQSNLKEEILARNIFNAVEMCIANEH